MKVSRSVGVLGAVASSVLALSACGSNNNSSTSAAGSPSTASSTSTAATSSGGGSGACASGTLAGQGSTFQLNIEQQWIKDFQSQCSGANVSYTGTGSGAGKAAFGNGTADFAGTDSLLKTGEQSAADSRCGSGNHAVVLPDTVGAIVVTYNLPGVSTLKLSGPTLAGIFAGTVKSWNDTAVKADNPGVTLPSIPVVPVHRSDKSGSTNIFSSYLVSQGGSAWTLGKGETLAWPGGQSAKGSDGVTTVVKQTAGGVTYTELSFATLRNLPVAQVKNAGGSYVAAAGASVSAALAAATVSSGTTGIVVKSNFAVSDATAYPLSAVSYVVVCDKGNKNLALLKAYLTYAVGAGQQSAAGLGYAPLPATLATKVTTAISALA